MRIYQGVVSGGTAGRASSLGLDDNSGSMDSGGRLERGEHTEWSVMKIDQVFGDLLDVRNFSFEFGGLLDVLLCVMQ